MSERIVEVAGASASQSCGATLSTGVNNLPFELVTETLRYLSWEDELWQAAAVSRRFYAAAWKAGLLIDRTITWSDTESYVPQLAVFNKIVQHSLCHASYVRLGLSFRASPGTRLEPEEWPAHYEAVMPEMQSILASITAALPVLVLLSFALNVRFSGLLAHAMAHAAPCLVELELDMHELELDVHMVTDRMVSTVRSDLFAGTAPKLRIVMLRDAYIGPAPVSAFSGVKHLTLSYWNTFTDIALAAHFPRLEDLRLQFFNDSLSPEPPTRVRLDGLRLLRLCVNDKGNCPLMPAVARSLDLGDVPVIEHGSDAVEWTQPPWHQDDALAIRIDRFGRNIYGTTMKIFPPMTPRRWHRTHHVRYWRRDTLAPLASLSGVTLLHLDSGYLPYLLDSSELRLSALRELHIDLRSDFVLPDIASTAPGLRSTKLQTLRLCASEEGVEPEVGAVASLGRALGVLGGLTTPSAVLELAGVKLAGAPGILDETFASVRTVGLKCCEDDEDTYPYQ